MYLAESARYSSIATWIQNGLRRLLPLLALAGILAAASPAEAQNRLSLNPQLLDAPGGTVASGDTFRYRVSFSCDLISIPSCDNAVVTVDLPPELVFVSSFFPPGDVASGVHDGSPTGGTVTFTFQPSVPAGNTGDLDITVRFPNGSTADGTMTTQLTGAATSMGTSLVVQTADLPKVTATASTQVILTPNLAGGFLDDCPSGSRYEVTIRPSSSDGSLNFVDVGEIALQLPVGVTGVSPNNGGLFDVPSNSVTWTGLGAVAVGSSLTVSVDVTFASPTFSAGQSVDASATAMVDPLNEPPGFSVGPMMTSDSVVQFAEAPDANVSKSFGGGRPSSLAPAEGQPFSYNVSISNSGNMVLDSLSVVDDGDGSGGPIAAGLDLLSVSTGAYTAGYTGTVTISFTTNMAGPAVLGSSPGNIDASFPFALGAGEVVTSIRWDFAGPIPVGMAPSTPAVIATAVRAGFPAGTVIDNHVTADWTANLTGLCGGATGPAVGSNTDNFQFNVNDAYTYLRPRKNETSSGPYFPNDLVSFSFDVTNDALANDAASGVVVTDLLPEFLDFQAGSQMFADNGTGVTLSMFEEIDNYNGTGRTLLRWTLSGDLDPGETVNITFDTEVLLGVIFGNLTNEMGMTFPAGPIQQICAGSSAVDVADLDADTSFADTLCTESDAVTIAAVAQLSSTKFVLGQCDTMFTPGLGTGVTVRGGIVDWRVEVRNVQTVPMENFVIVDILPFVGDTGVRDTTARDTAFRPLLVEPITPPVGGTVFYSLSGNPCRPEVGGPTSGCDAPNWSTIPPTPITATQSIKIEFGGLVLNPLDVLSFEWRMIAPADAPIAGDPMNPVSGEIAWNSFGFGSNRQDDGGFLGAEPNKVGIAVKPASPAMLGNFVWSDDDGDGTQNEPAATSGVNDVPVQIFDPGPDGMPRTGDDILVLDTITADDDLGNPGWYKLSNLPPGDYFVCFQPPPNRDITAQDVPGDEALDSDVDPLTLCSDVVTLGPTDENLDIDLGLLPAVTASLGNYVWFDRDGNGIQDEALQDGLNGVTVRLFVDDGDGNPEPGGDDGTPLQVGVTADDLLGNPGFYLFEDLIPGVPYFVQFTAPATSTGFTTRDAGGDDAVDSDARSSNGTSQVLTLVAGESNLTVDAGIEILSGTLSLGNVVWIDEDGNGILDAATDDDGRFDPLVPETAVNGVRLNLYLDLSGDGLPQPNEFISSTLTRTLAGKDGRYRFDDLPADDFIVEVAASNFAVGGPLQGLVSSTGFSANPNDDADNDDSGEPLGSAVLSRAITLAANNEPIADADDDLEDDDDINFTLDFGFVPGAAEDFDFGDAPDAGFGAAQGNYATTILDDGARHALLTAGNPYLGDCVDSDTGQQQSFPADADDLAGALMATLGTCASAGDDEDGVTFSSALLMIGGTFDLDVRSASATGCVVSGWIDWNQDGVFDNSTATEKVIDNIAVASTTVGFPAVAVPPTAVPGFTYARFRCSTAGGDAPTGPSPDGEVEDYRLQVMGADFGDAPDVPYGTLITSGGPVHDTDPNVDLYLGNCVDTEPDGQPMVLADGDDATLGTSRIGDCIVDEDGVLFDTMLVRGQMAQITVIASAPGRLDGWVDLDGVGGFAGADQVVVDQPVVAGTNTFNFAVPSNAAVGRTYARFRFSTAGGLSPGGMAADGEVEDYAVVIKGFDFGDAPEPAYPTTLASGGAQHVVDPASSLYLGACADPEDDGQPSPGADGDDLGAANSTTGSAGTCAGNDDENGVVFNTMVATCQMAQITVTAGAAGRLDAWLDYDKSSNNGFGGTSDQIFTNRALNAGPNVLTFGVPCDAELGDTFARFRFSSGGGLAPGGLAADGEVEDYPVFIKGVDFGDAADSHATLIGSGGPNHAVDPNAATPLLLGACVDTEIDARTPLDLSGDDGTGGTSTVGTCAVGNDDEDGVTFTSMITACQMATVDVVASTTGVLDAWVDFNRDGDFGEANERIFNGQAVVAGTNNLSFSVPCAVIPGASSTRFRLSSTGVASFSGPAMDGEVEDYPVTLKGADLGDALNSYATLEGSNGASHGIDPTAPDFFLGACVDTELNGQPTGTLDGDDLGTSTSVDGTCAVANDDEDGVTFDTMVIACQDADLTVTASAAGRLDAWIDYSGDGTFAQAGEQIAANLALAPGANSLTITVPCGVAPGQTASRFRFSSAGGLSFNGPSPDGEVEDHPVLVKGADLGDAPDTYGTSFGSGGPVHGVDPGAALYLGACADTETDAQTPLDGSGDDGGTGTGTVGTCVAGDDEDGITFDTMIIACQQTDLTVVAGAAGQLDAWLDFDGDGTFVQAGEQIFANQALTAGANSLSFNVPCSAAPGATYARFRLSSAGGLSSGGLALDGEVEDYAVTVKGVDFGDAPDTFSTLFGSTGPTHGVDLASPLHLGACVDTESDASAPLDATGDDLGAGSSTAGTCAAANDDEDGVTFDTMLNACQMADLTVDASGAGSLDAWIDFDGDGTFAQAGEQIFTSQALAAGANSLSFGVPCAAALGTTHARFRFSSTGGLAFSGPAMDGEVEDYTVPVKGSDLGDAPDSYSTSIGSGGPTHGVDPAVPLFLGACADTETDAQTPLDTTGDDTNTGTLTSGTCAVAGDDEDGVTFDTMVVACDQADLTVTASMAGLLDAWIDFDGDGTFAQPADQVFASQVLASGANSLSVNVPCTAADGMTVARFRFSTAGGLSFDGDAADGEVEDYSVLLKAADLGDAPDSYQTLVASNGPFHAIDPGANLFLGTCVDGEPDGQPAASAAGDDTVVGSGILGTCTGNDDEDGVVFDTMIIASQLAQITVTASAAGRLDAWIDFNADGSFAQVNDQIFANTALVAGPNVLTFTPPADTVDGITYARFRFSSSGSLAFTGPADDGEVEDYLILADESDFGDALDSYGTLFGSGGPLHGVDAAANLYLGACVDAETEGQPSATVDGDDLAVGTGTILGTCVGGDDEDGVTFDTMVVACESADLTVTASAAGFLDAWIDFDGDGVFSNPAEQIFASQAVVAGANTLSFTPPCGAIPGDTVSRFRLSTSGGLAPGGPAPDGEIEDHPVTLKGADLGDAPDSYATLFASNGPRHAVDPALGFFLGTCVDTDSDGQPSAGSNDDDANAGTSAVGACAALDDEDGVVFTSAVTACKPAFVTVTASAPGLLDAWIDFDHNGDFTNAGPSSDQIFASQPLALGVNNLSFAVPCDAIDGNTYARFRLSSAGGLSFDGAAADGEVEDYLLSSNEADLGDAPDSYSTLFASGGPVHGVVAGTGLYLGSCVDGEAVGQPSLGADGDDLGLGTTVLGSCVAGDDEDGVVFDSMLIACGVTDLTVVASAPGLLDAWVDFDADGNFSAGGDQVFAGQALVAGANALSFNVPCTAAPGISYARFRFSSAGGLGFGGTTPDGEVEDYQVLLKGADLGDAPDSYSTRFAAGGPFHGVDPSTSVYLGACADTEPDGQDSLSASDDDTGVGSSVAGTCVAADDEDGVIFDTLVTACQTAQITVTAGSAGLLSAWIDYDADGTFDLPRDQALTDEALVAGANPLSFFVPCDAAAASSYARFRFSTAGVGTSSGGPAADGEIEDYVVSLQDSDFGDAPDTYSTLLASGGPLHGLDPGAGLYLGSCVDAEAEGQPSGGSDGDDLGAGISSLGTCAGPDDEDGVVFDTMVIACEVTSLTVTASASGFLDAWVDLDGDGTFAGPADQVFTAMPVTAGATSLSFPVPCDAIPGASYARFRISSTGGLPFGGPAIDGEVEDHPILVKGSDLGDAPDSYATRVTSGGPRHGVDPVAGVFLGTCIDTEGDGQPALGADGDDLNAGGAPTGTVGACAAGDDEDGVVFTTDVNVCLAASVTVTSSANALLDAWIDFDGDGTFTGPSDQIFAAVPVAPGANALGFNVPCNALPGDSYARFRLSSVGGLGIGGPAADGEIEDYALLIKGFDFGDAPDPVYPTLFASDGARHVVLTTGNPTLGTLVDIETEAQQSPDHLGDDADGSDDEDGITFSGLYIPGAPAQLIAETGPTGGLLSAWNDFNRDGDWTDPGEQIATDLALGASTLQTLAFSVPDGALTGTTCARFRISSSGGLTSIGQALDGEVEDYEIPITAEGARIGLSKEIVEIDRIDEDMSHDITFLLTVQNFGNIEIESIQVMNDLATAFADAESFSVVSVTSAELSVNPAFDGDGDPNVLTGTDSLAPTEIAFVEITVNVVPGGNPGPYFCSASLTGTSTAGTDVEDISQEGMEPDGNNDGDPGNDSDPTVVVLPQPVVEIPTLDWLGLLGLALLLIGLATRRLQ